MKTEAQLKAHSYPYRKGYIQGYNGEDHKCHWLRLDNEYIDHKKGWRQGVADAYNDGVERTKEWIDRCVEEGKRQSPSQSSLSKKFLSPTEEIQSRLSKKISPEGPKII